MNLQLHHVVADIAGATGMRIIRAIISGERNPSVLASMRDKRCHSSVETIEKALTGHYRAEHLFGGRGPARCWAKPRRQAPQGSLLERSAQPFPAKSGALR